MFFYFLSVSEAPLSEEVDAEVYGYHRHPVPSLEAIQRSSQEIETDLYKSKSKFFQSIFASFLFN